MVVIFLTALFTEVMVVMWTVSVSARQPVKAALFSGIIAALGYFTNALVVKAADTILSAVLGGIACAIACYGTLKYLELRKRFGKGTSPFTALTRILEEEEDG